MPKKPVAQVKKRESKPQIAVKSEPRPPRRLKTAQYKSFRLTKRIKYIGPHLPSGWQLFRRSFRLLWSHRLLFLWIVAIYGLLDIFLVRGLSNGNDVQSIKSTFDGIFNNGEGKVVGSLSIIAYLVSSSGSNTDIAGVYQSLLLIIVSLALIWTLRQVLGGSKVTARMAYYQGMYPLIPFILVLLVVALQLIPFLVGAFIYTTVTTNGIAIFTYEKMLWGALFALLALATLYMLCSSIFALYIVTLPDMTPMKALRSARDLVRHRRWIVLRKILFLPLVSIILIIGIMLPIILYATVIAQWVFFIISMLLVAVVHSYIYGLYRELLND